MAVYSTADKDSLHVRLADESVCIGPPPGAQSYLNMANIVAAAEITGADAIHPGYGFLAENPKFAEICRECDIRFIGPSPASIESAGNKSNARQVASRGGIPVIEGSSTPLKEFQEAANLAERIGYPVLLKAVAGGGGRGMRIVETRHDLESSFSGARMEAKSAFGDDSMYMEKYLRGPRHIEVQVLVDSEGQAIHLGERECSVQRRHQKLIEESPSPCVSPQARKMIGSFGCRIARMVNYGNAGTIEFLMDSSGKFYFIEMNTRIQVEHPVTELVYNVDIVKEQIRIAAGHPLLIKPQDIRAQGHAIEFRINAEDPDNNFAPSPGLITAMHLPLGPWVRLDTFLEAGSTVQPYYDSLIAKLIVWGNNRTEAITRARRALDEFRVEGVRTTIPFHIEVLNSPAFVAGDYDTSLVETLIRDRDTSPGEHPSRGGTPPSDFSRARHCPPGLQRAREQAAPS